ncbi:MAG TPA: cytochrome-c oxidase, cbb3-type subunit III [Candidatus Binatia bacterium]|jgi:cytochrome c oxidase cbb3-type subunit 3
MSGGWSLWIATIVVINVVGSAWLLLWAGTRREGDDEGPKTVGHAFDGIEEYDMPLPRWWLWLFVGTIGFAGVYLVLYPGFGAFPGVLGWTEVGQHEAEVREADAKVQPLYAAYAARPIEDLARDSRAVATGRHLFANTCAACHGADAHGGVGFPNLADDDWIWGGDPETIQTTILGGRMAFMPAFAPALGGEQGIREVIQYVLSLSGQPADAQLAEAGKARFGTICIACHGPDGKGNKAMGAPNLTDSVWLFGGTAADIEYGLRNGRSSKMPAHADILGNDKAHLVAAYVYSLSHVGAAE